ncbi:MAG: heavy-metal-associated domain-containing protein [Erysipelotrichaceae bacterium]|nr:heavy-metal-associated domain-containing protein [Erysipelotrichaceae bacterium]
MKKTIKVDDMMCKNCVRHVTDILSNVEGTTVLDVNLETKLATVETTADDDTLKNALTKQDFQVSEIK